MDNLRWDGRAVHRVGIHLFRSYRLHLLGRFMDLWMCSNVFGKVYRREVDSMNEVAVARLQKESERVEKVWIVQAETERRLEQIREVLLLRTCDLLQIGFVATIFTSWSRAICRRIIRTLRHQIHVQVDQHGEEVRELQKNISDIQMRTFRKLSQMQDEYLNHLESRRDRESAVIQESYDRRLELLEEAVDQLTAAKDEALLQCSYLETALDEAIVAAQDKDEKISHLEQESRDKVNGLARSLDEAIQDVTEATETNQVLQKDLEAKEKALSEIRNRFAEEEARSAALAASLEDARAKDAQTQLEKARLQRKEEMAQERLLATTTANKELKIELEAQKTGAHRELSRAKGMISKMKDERDAAVQRELQVSMQRHASAARGSERQASAVQQHAEPDSKSMSASSSVAVDRGTTRFSATLPDFATVAKLLTEQAHAGAVVPFATARSSSSSEGTGDEGRSFGAQSGAVPTVQQHAEPDSRSMSASSSVAVDRGTTRFSATLPDFATVAKLLTEQANAGAVVSLATARSSSSSEGTGDEGRSFGAQSEEKWKREAPLRLKKANEEIKRARDIEDDLKTATREGPLDPFGVDRPGVEVNDSGRLSKEERRRRWQEEIRRNGRASASFISDLFGPPEKGVEVEPIEDDAPAVGVGIAITDKPPYRVTELVASGAAAISGSIQVGDYLLRVKDVDVTGLPFAEVKALILGPVGTTLQLKIDRRSKDGQHKILNATIVRSKLSRDASAVLGPQNRLSRTNAPLRAPVNLIDVSVEEESPFPSRRPQPIRLPASAASPSQPPPKFEVDGPIS